MGSKLPELLYTDAYSIILIQAKNTLETGYEVICEVYACASRPGKVSEELFNMQVADIDDTVKRISSHKGVLGVIIAARDGMPIKTTMDNTSTVLYVGTAISLFERSQSMIRDIEPTNFLQYMRIRTIKYELIVSVEEDYVVIAVQNTRFVEG